MAALHVPLRRAAARTRQLFLALRLGERRYVIAAREVVSVLADQPVMPLAAVPDWVGGLLVHKGAPVPVIDLVARVTGQASVPGRGRRIVLLRLESALKQGRARGLIGVWAHDVNETLMLESAAFEPSGVHFPDARFLGPVLRHGDDWLQRLEVTDLLEPDVRAVLFAAVDNAREQPD